jgi:tetratricopeptide (TPR) repeat protein
MKQSLSSDKYNIAWFKLAEYVSRGEKERALGIYRLLSHSIEDRAFARQLEGDILWSFNDTQAADKYQEAAQLYRQDQRVLQAAAIYEHLVMLVPDSMVYLEHLVELYAHLEIKTKVAAYSARLFEQLLQLGNFAQASSVLESYGHSGMNEIQCHERLLFALLKNADSAPELIMGHLKKTIIGYVAVQNKGAIEQLLVLLQSAHETYYQAAMAYLNQRKQ